MKLADYAPGLTVIQIYSLSSRFSKLSDKTRFDCVGETISPEPVKREGDLSHSYYAEVRWRDGRTTICSLMRIAIATTR